ncbi:MAG: hypothetical protein WD007_02830, partial [Nitriliruptoraceae bacterium]
GATRQKGATSVPWRVVWLVAWRAACRVPCRVVWRAACRHPTEKQISRWLAGPGLGADAVLARRTLDPARRVETNLILTAAGLAGLAGLVGQEVMAGMAGLAGCMVSMLTMTPPSNLKAGYGTGFASLIVSPRRPSRWVCS